MGEILTGWFGGVDDCSGQLCAEPLELSLPPSSQHVVHGRQIGEHSIHERFSPRADQLSDIEQAIDGHCRRQGCFFRSGNPLFEQKDRIERDDVLPHPVVDDRLRWCQTEPSAGAKTTARRPRGEGRRGYREPFGAVLGGINTAPTVRATRSRSDNAHRQGGMGTAAGVDSAISTVVFRSWPSSRWLFSPE